MNNKRWDTHSFALAEVREVRYETFVAMRGTAVHGIRFKAGGKTVRVLPGLKAADAEKILLAIRAFGADVPDEPVVPSKLKEAS